MSRGTAYRKATTVARPVKRLTPIWAIIAMILLCLSVVPVYAWEFTLSGETVLRTRYLTRTGNRDIFGAMNDDTVNLGVNHIKNWPTPRSFNRHDDIKGVLAGEPGFGSDASMMDYRCTLFPKLIVNKAITLDGSVNLTSLGILSGGRPYDNAPSGTTPANSGGFQNSLWVPLSIRMAGSHVPNTFVTVQWWRLSMDLPIFSAHVGMKPDSFGMGLIYNQRQYSSTGVSLSVRHGPLTITHSYYRDRTGAGWDLFARDSMDPFNPWRKDTARDYGATINVGLTYKTANMSAELTVSSYRILASSGNYGGRNDNGTPGPRPVGRIPNPDTVEYDLYAAMKYYNGWFFFNGEAAHFWQYRTGRGVANHQGNQVRQNQDLDSWVYGIETGIRTGPAKLTFCYVRATGDDPSTRKTTEEGGDGDPLNPVFMRPWGYLMYWTYGTGLAFGPGGWGQVSNCHHLGFRVDYAVAANLNVFGVWSRAWRDQPGAFQLAGNNLHTQRRFTNDDLMAAQSGGNVRQVPGYAKDIGWELDIGFQWQWLENLTWATTIAYWQPGDWWSHSYPNTAVIYAHTAPEATPTSNSLLARINPARPIDPLLGLELAFQVNF